MAEPIKTVKSREAFIEYTKYFITELLDSIKDNNLKEGEELDVRFETYSLPYYYEGIVLVDKTIEAKGYMTRLPTYHTDLDEDGNVFYRYKWTIKKPKIYDSNDDLPF